MMDSKPDLLPEAKDAASESEDAASDILAAIKSGDAKALDLALKRHQECGGGEYEEDDEEA